ncbi:MULTISPECIES: hypothetical protein [unclassified Staphylococcus]|uniref:hypothetical protein n=1 Tax=unclassified Staphylococcus TaxID=91994 RepID=UPI0010103ED2|nr:MULTISPECIES: hypothetical protein [unclassified Staphylococcus]MBL0377878.1 hypothetical protein [Staphylococcus sp. S75]MBL0383829.1 hypothetical protein [Staphylococcus sp. S59]MBL0401873.1 hypothetical protein [Staphylococcus sp. S36]RXZ28108.1 hypothetical protein ESM34_07075 [Staphylococcus sp. SNAZ 59]RXZ32971.1 hypothetical protein ESM33_10760 [Staphylococcus sp. SNAZ 36]
MKKLLMVFASIALIAIILAAGVFGYSSFKNLTDNKEDKKTEEVSKKKENKKQDNESNNDDNTDQNQKMNSEQQKQSEQATTENNNSSNNIGTQQNQQIPVTEEETQVTDNEGNNIDDMDSEEFISKYTQGMDEDEAQTVKDMAEEDSGYEDFLRGQVEARQKGQGGNY